MNNKLEEADKKVMFWPTRDCPVCGLSHEVRYKYRGTDVLVCPKTEKDKLMFFNEEKAREELAIYKEQKRIVEGE